MQTCEFCGQRIMVKLGRSGTVLTVCDDCNILQDNKPAKFQVRGLCEALTLTRKDLGKLTGNSPAQLREYWSEEFVEINEPVLKKTIEELLLVHALAVKLCAGEEQAQRWYRTPNQNFHERTPIGLILNGELAQVIDTLIKSPTP
jgi:hypothetical protein